jgi:hypothetical protein
MSSLLSWARVAMALSAILLIFFLLAVYLLKTRTMESGNCTITGKGEIDDYKNSQTNNKISDSMNPDECTKIMSGSEERLEPKLSNKWQCACEGGNGLIFLPQSLMKSFSGPGAAMRLGAGGCYHKQM